MSDALPALHTALVAALSVHPVLNAQLTGIYDGPPPRAAFPYLSIGDGTVTDWSTKTAIGREVQLALTIWDDGEDVSRLQALMGATEDAVAALARNFGGWRIASLIFQRARIVRDPAGPWAGLIDHRIRMIQN